MEYLKKVIISYYFEVSQLSVSSIEKNFKGFNKKIKKIIKYFIKFIDLLKSIC